MRLVNFLSLLVLLVFHFGWPLFKWYIRYVQWFLFCFSIESIKLWCRLSILKIANASYRDWLQFNLSFGTEAMVKNEKLIDCQRKKSHFALFLPFFLPCFHYFCEANYYQFEIFLDWSAGDICNIKY